MSPLRTVHLNAFFAAFVPAPPCLLLLAWMVLAMPARAIAADTVLMPLDDRPVCRQLPAELAEIAGEDIAIPPRNLLGLYQRPGRSAVLQQWLDRFGEHAKTVIVSVDMLASGGLVASRTGTVSLAEAEQRMAALQEYHLRHPQTHILGFDTVQRMTVTVFDETTAKYYTILYRYLQLAYRPDAEQTAESRRQAAELKAQLPPDLLDQYFATRQRNHAINLLSLQYTAEGVFDSLVIGLDDTALHGPQVAERQELQARIDALGIGNRVVMRPGADEIAMELLTKSLLERWHQPLRVFADYAAAGGPDLVAPYEDRPLAQTVAAHVRSIGAQLASRPEDADIVLALHVPDRRTTGYGYDRQGFRRRIEGYLDRHIVVALVDIDSGFIEDLLPAGSRLDELAAFAGWGTAGNRIGCALSEAAVAVGAARVATSAKQAGRAAQRNAEFLFRRIVDDHFYLRTVLPQLRAVGKQYGGLGPVLEPGQEWVQAEMRKRLYPLAEGLFADHFRGRRWQCSDPQSTAVRLEIDAYMPWNRPFEIELHARFLPPKG